MKHRADPSGGRPAQPPTDGPRHHRRRRKRASRAAVVGAKVLTTLVAAVVVVVTGVGWMTYRTASTGITKSQALVGVPASPGSDQNILIMGLDTRRDQRGRPFAQDIYNALHAGDEDSGEDDSDSLILLHLPAGDAAATAVSIPRDDYVDLAGCPTSDCRGKIKQAYRYAYQHVLDRDSYRCVSRQTWWCRGGYGAKEAQHSASTEQQAREAGRKAEISTVRRLLQVPIDHFVEVSLVGFFQIARVVEPITVCLNEDTSDPYYSGADFHRGRQQIDAAKAMGFVRQRRDSSDAWFSDLDRTRRQQAFIASLVNALRHSGALANPIRLRALLDVAKQNVAVDAGFDLDEFVRTAAALPNRPITLYTLPVTGFTKISDGQDVNLIDVSAIRSIVHDLVGSESPADATTDSVEEMSDSTSASSGRGAQQNAGSVKLDVVNASGKSGEATSLEKSLATGRFTEGEVSTAASTDQTSTIAYGPGAKAAAIDLADELDITASASDAVAPSTVRLTAGTDYSGFGLKSTSTSATTSTAATVTTVPATATGTQAPTPTNLTRMTVDGVPCVK